MLRARAHASNQVFRFQLVLLSSWMKKHFCYRSKKMFRALRVYLAIVIVVFAVAFVVAFVVLVVGRFWRATSKKQ